MLPFSRLLVLRNSMTSQNVSRRLDSIPYSSWLSKIFKPTPPPNPPTPPISLVKPTPPTPTISLLPKPNQPISLPKPTPPTKSEPSSSETKHDQSKEKVQDSKKISAPHVMFHVKDAKPDKFEVHTLYNRVFFNLSTKKPIPKKLETSDSGHELPKDINCIGSSHGWLAFVNPSDCSLYLVNPLSSEIIKLPTIETLPEFHGTYCKKSDDGMYKIAGFICRDKDNKESIKSAKYLSENFVSKVVLSSCPKSQDCIVVLATHGQHSKLAFCKISDDKWTILESNCCFGDVIYSSHDKKIYAISNCANLEIEAWDISDPKSPKKTLYLPPIRIPDGIPLRANCFPQMYLVESPGRIFVVAKFSGWQVAEDGSTTTCEDDDPGKVPYKTFAFSVLKFDPAKEKFEQVNSLGDKAVFLGTNHSFCLTASEFSGVTNNKIHYSDDYQVQKCHSLSTNRGLCDANKDYPYGGYDCGDYDLGDESIKSVYSKRSIKLSFSPVFIAPN